MQRALGLAVFSLAIASLAPADETAVATPEHIGKLIKQLDAEAFSDREAAREALVKLGSAAKEPLEAALKQEAASAELKLRGAEVLKKLELEELRRKAVSLASLIEQARLANHKKLDDEKLEALLEQLVEVWTEVSGSPKKLPVSLKGLPVAAADEADHFARGALITIDSGQISSVRSSIVLAETAVDISSARDSIIIAGISASVSSPRNCIIIGGYDVDAGGEGNLILSGAYAQGSIVRESVLGAPKGASVSIAENLILLNTPPTGRDPFDGRIPERVPKYVQSERVILEVPQPKNELEDIITITQAIPHREPLVLFRRAAGDGEYVARAGQELKFPDGKPIPELAGWRLTYCGRRGIAVFRKDEQQAVFFTGARR